MSTEPRLLSDDAGNGGSGGGGKGMMNPFKEPKDIIMELDLQVAIQDKINKNKAMRKQEKENGTN
jgi:hypothetical protein